MVFIFVLICLFHRAQFLASSRWKKTYTLYTCVYVYIYFIYIFNIFSYLASAFVVLQTYLFCAFPHVFTPAVIFPFPSIQILCIELQSLTFWAGPERPRALPLYGPENMKHLCTFSGNYFWTWHSQILWQEGATGLDRNCLPASTAKLILILIHAFLSCILVKWW